MTITRNFIRGLRTARPAAAVVLTAFFTAACGSLGPGRDSEASREPVAQTIPYAPYMVGNTYRIAGRWYEPREDFAYDREGIASWYGPNFHGRRTANGETYDMHQMTAAHPTLPMPSIVRVTNLSNGRSVIVRINDRGPYAHNRIIDLSREAARRLGMLRAGIARVRVQLMREESVYLRDMAERGRATHTLAGEMVARANANGTTLSAEDRASVRAAATENEPENEPENERTRPTREARAVARATVETEPVYRTADRRAVAAESDARTSTTRQIARRSAAGDAAAAERRRSAAGDPSIFVQAGAFSERTNAERAEARLSHLGETLVSPIRIRETVFYRVRVGPVGSARDGDNLLARVVRSGYPNARIVVE